MLLAITPIKSENSWRLTQQIGLAFRCRVALDYNTQKRYLITYCLSMWRHKRCSKLSPQLIHQFFHTHDIGLMKIIASLYSNNKYSYSVKCQEISEGQLNFTISVALVEMVVFSAQVWYSRPIVALAWC